MNSFYMNGYLWRVKFVPFDDPVLIDRTNTYRVATTHPVKYCIYLSDRLSGLFLTRVFAHELGHCVLFSFDLLWEIHRMVKPQYWMDAEEWVCNFIADYGLFIFSILYDILGEKAIDSVPYWIDEFVKLRKDGKDYDGFYG